MRGQASGIKWILLLINYKVSSEVPTQSKNSVVTELLKCSVFIPEIKMSFGFNTRPMVLFNFSWLCFDLILSEIKLIERKWIVQYCANLFEATSAV